MTPYDILQKASKQTGWDKESMLNVVLEHIRNQNEEEAFAEHVDMAVERETSKNSNISRRLQKGKVEEESDEMDRYAVRVDMIIRAKSQPEANDFMSEILNQHLTDFLSREKAAIVDWKYGSAGEEKYRSPAYQKENPYPRFTADTGT